MSRRDFLRQATVGGLAAILPDRASSQQTSTSQSALSFNVRSFGATGDGKTIDTPAVNRAIEAAAAAGGGTVLFPSGTYASFTIRLKSHICLRLEAGATILAAPVPPEGTASGGYDPAGPP